MGICCRLGSTGRPGQRELLTHVAGSTAPCQVRREPTAPPSRGGVRWPSALHPQASPSCHCLGSCPLCWGWESQGATRQDTAPSPGMFWASRHPPAQSPHHPGRERAGGPSAHISSPTSRYLRRWEMRPDTRERSVGFFFSLAFQSFGHSWEGDSSREQLRLRLPLGEPWTRPPKRQLTPPTQQSSQRSPPLSARPRPPQHAAPPGSCAGPGQKGTAAQTQSNSREGLCPLDCWSQAAAPLLSCRHGHGDQNACIGAGHFL